MAPFLLGASAPSSTFASFAWEIWAPGSEDDDGSGSDDDNDNNTMVVVSGSKSSRNYRVSRVVTRSQQWEATFQLRCSLGLGGPCANSSSSLTLARSLGRTQGLLPANLN